MPDTDIEPKVREILAKKYKVPVETITAQTRLAEDLGVDSFGALELMFELEEAFSLQIADSEIEHIRTVKDIVDYLATWRLKAAAP